MKKVIISLSMIASLLLGAESANTLLNSAVDDIVYLNNYSKENLQQLSQNENFLQEFTAKVNRYENEVSTFAKTQIEDFSSKDEAKNALESVEKLSYQSVALAKIAAYLASHQADNANESYNNTLTTLTKTTLRLSDDIGKMADRIGEMADRIGVMADRIVRTQEIQSKNYQETLHLAQFTLSQTSQTVQMTQQNILKEQKSLNAQAPQYIHPQQPALSAQNPQNSIPQPIHSQTPQTTPQVQVQQPAPQPSQTVQIPMH